MSHTGQTTLDVVSVAPLLGVFKKLFKGSGKGIDINNPVLDNVRTGSALKIDAQHAFNDIIDNYASSAQKFDLVGGDKYNYSHRAHGRQAADSERRYDLGRSYIKHQLQNVPPPSSCITNSQLTLSNVTTASNILTMQ
jgi:hypothetical protein